MKKILLLIIASVILIPSFVTSQFPPVREVTVLYPVDMINITQGNIATIPVTVNNTGNVTLANLNITFETPDTPEGWFSSWNSIKILYPEIVKTVNVNLRAPENAFGYYNITLHVISPLAGLDKKEPISIYVHGEKPPGFVKEENLRNEADEKISKAKESLQKALDMGLNVTGVSNVFSQALDNFNEGNYTQAIFLAELSYNASEILIEEGPPKAEETHGTEGGFDYTLILLLLLFIIVIIAINKYIL